MADDGYVQVGPTRMVVPVAKRARDINDVAGAAGHHRR
jgi:hypothetical protein